MTDQQSSQAINVSEATAEELDSVAALCGHGFEIVRYREERGGFTALRQLDEVPGSQANLPKQIARH